MQEITIYTDGACTGNPGVGGYGIVMIAGNYRKEFAESFRLTTNQRMELLAVIVALEKLKICPSNVVIYSDSQYVVNAINEKWLEKWVRTDFKDKKNPDLWKRFLEINKKHNVKFVWVKGHSYNSENNRCDLLATEAAKKIDKNIDTFYENIVQKEQNSKISLY